MAFSANPWAFNFAKSSSWLSVSDALERSVNIAPMLHTLSKINFRFSIIFNKECWVSEFAQ